MHEDQIDALTQDEWDDWQGEQVTEEMEAAWGPPVIVPHEEEAEAF